MKDNPIRNKEIYHGFEIGTKQDEIVYYDPMWRGCIKSKKTEEYWVDDYNYPTAESALREIKVVVDKFLEKKHRKSILKLKAKQR